MRRIFLVLMLWPGVVGATNRYIHQAQGNDANAGTFAAPYKTCNKVFNLTTLAAGDTVFIGPGRYDERTDGAGGVFGYYDTGPIALRQSGSTGNPIVIRSWHDSTRPTILGNLPAGCNDPRTCGTAGWDRFAIEVISNNYITFDSIVVKHAVCGFFIDHAHDIVIRNCVSESIFVTDVGCSDENNTGAIFMGYDNDPVTAHYTHHNQIMACTLRTVYDKSCAPPYTIFQIGNSGGVLGYNQNHVQISNTYMEDCYAGVYWKGRDDSSSIIGCHIKDCSYGVFMAAFPHDDTVAYTIIEDCNDGINMEAHTDAAHTEGIWRPIVYNNTFFNVQSCSFSNVGGNNQSTYNAKFWNNIFHYSNQGIYMFGTSSLWSIDYSNYNLFFSSSSNVGRIQSTSYTLANWRTTAHLDSQSTKTNPLFMDTTASGGRDFRLQAGSPAITGGRGGSYESWQGALNPGIVDTCPNIATTLPVNGDTVAVYTVPLVFTIDLDDSAESVIFTLWGEPTDITPDQVVFVDTLTTDTTLTYDWGPLSEDVPYYFYGSISDSDCTQATGIRNFYVNAIAPPVIPPPGGNNIVIGNIIR